MDRHDQSAAGGVGRRDVTAVGIDDAFGDCQAEAGATGGLAAGLIRPGET